MMNNAATASSFFSRARVCLSFAGNGGMLLVILCLDAIVCAAAAHGATSMAEPVAAYANRRASAVPSPAPAVRAQHAYRHVLGHVPATRLAHERSGGGAPANAKGVPPKIGFPRTVDTLKDAAAMTALMGWTVLPEGGQVAAFSIVSPEAAGLRIGLRVHSLPREATLRLYVQGDKTATHSIGGQEILGTIERNLASGASGDAAHTYWTPLSVGSEATVEIELPAGIRTDTVRIAVPRISHLFLTPLQYENYQVEKRAASCNIDVSCYLTDWVDHSKSVALMDFVDAGHAYLCTGTLLADSSNSFTPYFLSANHCIPDQTVASTLETTWFYRSTYCNGAATFPGSTTLSGGATLLYRSTTTDTSFMRLNRAAPEGAIFAGWLPALPARYSAVTGVHHPTGALQKISFGYVSDYEACVTDDSSAFYCSSAATATAQHIQVSWQQGITEEGSSGSGLWVRHTDGSYYVVGTLHGGSSYCGSDGTDSYGRFDLAYNASLKQWLNVGAPAEYSLAVGKTGSGTVSGSPGGIDCGSACLEIFDAGTGVTLTATPASGFDFAGWGGACTGTAPTCSVALTEAQTVQAYFMRTLTQGTPATGLSGALNSEMLYAITLPAGATDLQVRSSGGSGDVDMFVGFGAIPTTDAYDCVSENPDNVENCFVAAPAQGTYYILLKGYAAYSGVTLTASYATTHAADCLFDWAEQRYPGLLAPAGQASQSLEGYYYRYYGGTESYLATLGGNVYYLDVSSGNGIQDLGTLSGWLATAGCN